MPMKLSERKYFVESMYDSDRCLIDCMEVVWNKLFPNNKIQSPTISLIKSIISSKHEHDISPIDRFEKYVLGRNVRSIEKFQLKYGLQNGQIMFDNYRLKQAMSNSFEYKNKKFGMTEHEFSEYNKSRAVTLKNLVERHGEVVGKEMFDGYCEKQKYAGCKYEYFIEKYGIEHGRKKYFDVVIAKSNASTASIDGTSYNRKSLDLFSRLIERLKLNSDKCYFAMNPYELHLTSDDTSIGEIYFYDFVDLDNMIIIEFQDSSHLSKSVRSKDARKKEVAESHNFKLVEVWDSVMDDMLNVLVDGYEDKIVK